MVFDDRGMSAPAKFRSDVIYFHEFSKSKFVELKPDQFELINNGKPIVLTGEKGYRTAIVSHGISGKHHKCYYFEVEVLPPKTPLPFVNIKPGVRVGLCNVDVQNTDKPLGSNKISYGYSNTGKLINDSLPKMQNNSYKVGDIISVVINRFPNKPDFLKTANSSAMRQTGEAPAKNDKLHEQMQTKLKDFSNKYQVPDQATA